MPRNDNTPAERRALMLARKARYRAKHRTALQEKQQQYREDHPDEERARDYERYWKDPEAERQRAAVKREDRLMDDDYLIRLRGSDEDRLPIGLQIALANRQA